MSEFPRHREEWPETGGSAGRAPNIVTRQQGSASRRAIVPRSLYQVIGIGAGLDIFIFNFNQLTLIESPNRYSAQYASTRYFFILY